MANLTPEALAKAEEIARACSHGAHITWPDDTERVANGPDRGDWDTACPACIARALTEQVRATKRQIERLDKEKEQLWKAVQQWQEESIEKSHEIERLRAALFDLVEEVKRWRNNMDLESPVLHAARETLVRVDCARAAAQGESA